MSGVHMQFHTANRGMSTGSNSTLPYLADELQPQNEIICISTRRGLNQVLKLAFIKPVPTN